ncbi:hypothetical protein SAMN04489733_7179 [Amycolatopsis keratiniphila]|nr:hypothetical protein SAMN04489733_7179 [Amycolatopsis keratiniphila]
MFPGMCNELGELLVIPEMIQDGGQLACFMVLPQQVLRYGIRREQQDVSIASRTASRPNVLERHGIVRGGVHELGETGELPPVCERGDEYQLTIGNVKQARVAHRRHVVAVRVDSYAQESGC